MADQKTLGPFLSLPALRSPVTEQLLFIPNTNNGSQLSADPDAYNSMEEELPPGCSIDRPLGQHCIMTGVPYYCGDLSVSRISLVRLYLLESPHEVT